MYASSTAVFCMEVVKFICCNLTILYESGSVASFTKQMTEELTLTEVIRVSIPSFLYTVQNNLLYFALSNLDAATYQVCYQSKILTTAIFSVLLLNKNLSLLQWGSLVILTIGVSITQLSNSNSSSHSSSFVGFIAVIFAAILSGFAGVYFEKILKGSRTSVWMRNVQMGVSSIILAYVGVYFSGDTSQVLSDGFFYGYNALVISVILLQAIGGLVVAVVVKYADNILKGFAASFSIITSLLLCYFILQDFEPTLTFLTGAILVNLSMYLYSYTSPSIEKELSTHSTSFSSLSSPRSTSWENMSNQGLGSLVRGKEEI